MLSRSPTFPEELRRNPRPLPSGPITASTDLKYQDNGLKLTAKRWDHHFSAEGLALQPSTLKAAALELDGSMISLAAARPTPHFYPWESISTKFVSFTPSPSSGGATDHSSTSKFEPNSQMTCTKGSGSYDLGTALNYGYAAGSPLLLRFVTEHVDWIHSPKYSGWQTVLSCGSTSAIDLCFRLLCNRGDWILTAEYTYSGTISVAKTQGLKIAGVRMDEEGLMPDSLAEILGSWNEEKEKRPRVLYMVPCGQNPTGATQSTKRRKEIYAVAEQYDLIIVEDDPYYYLSLGASKTSTDANFVAQLPVSYLSLDVSGRVIRLDSTSKILAPGLRCGWLTASSQFTERFLALTELGTVEPSGPSQVMLYKLLNESWGHDGFANWLRHLSVQYSQRREIMIEGCRKHLPSNNCKWDVPEMGMFLWVRLNVVTYPGLQGCHDIEDRIYERSRKKGVLVSKGSWFRVDEDARLDDVFFRLTFAAASEDALEPAIAQFGEAVREELRTVAT